MASQRIPKISIVTPSLNQGQFLQVCIDSVRSQNWANIEHFVIDGGSTDKTMDVIRQNEDWLSGYVSEPDKGAADAINKGLEKCTGDIIAWLNADDFYLPGAFEEVAKAYEADPEASFWFGNGIRADEDGHEIAVFNKNRMRYDHQALIRGLDYILQPSTFMNPKILAQVGGLNTALKWSFDWDLWIRMAEHAAPFPIEAKLSASREWGATLTASGGFKRVEELRLLGERYSGDPLTPGALCYWLDALTKQVAQSNQGDPDAKADAVMSLWTAAQHSMRQLGVTDEGFPHDNDAVEDMMSTTDHSHDHEAVEEVLQPQIKDDGPKIIAVDLYPLIAGVSGGIVPWVQGVLREMARLYPEDKLVMYHRPGVPPLAINHKNVEFIPLDDHPIAFYDAMGRHCEEIGAATIIRTYPQELHPAFPMTKQIFVIPDIQHEFFPEFFSDHVLAARRRAFAYALSCGGAIATMTGHSYSTMVENGWTRTDDVFLMPAALPEELIETPKPEDLPAEARKFDKFFYMPANLWPHKNHRRLFEAFKRAYPHLPPKTGLILSGNPDGLSEVIKGYEDLPIVHLGYLPHRQVAALFSQATALVYFSLFEGFGMPLLEAFHHGTPVLCSNTTSLPEVGGDAVLACDPTDESAMAGLMKTIMTDPGLRDRLSEKAKLRVLAYDWAQPAHALRAAVDRVSRNPAEYPQRQPLVSIVMPTRNHARFIRAAIDSVLDQNYPNVELLVMDGVSTDNTVEILKSYGDRIRWISEPDKGQTDAINKGTALLKGEILAYLNSDDILLPGAIETAVRYFNEHPECDMIYGNADYIDVNGHITGAYNTAEFSFERLMTDCCVCQPASFWQRRIVDRIGPFDVTMQTAMDYEYWLRMARFGGIIRHIGDKLAQSRLHEDAKTLAMRGKIYEEIFQICERHGGYVSFSYYLGLWSYRLYEGWGGGHYLRKVTPHAYRVPAFLHFSTQLLKIGSDRRKTQYVSRTLFSVIDRRSPAIGRIIRKAWATSPALRKRFL